MLSYWDWIAVVRLVRRVPILWIHKIKGVHDAKTGNRNTQ